MSASAVDFHRWSVDQIGALNGWPSGVAVSRSGRLFVSLPQANDQAAIASLVEIVAGHEVPFPPADPGFWSVQGIRCGADDCVYALDTGSDGLSGCHPDRAALWKINVEDGTVAHRYAFSHEVLFTTSYLNDLAVDTSSGTAWLIDSGGDPPHALIQLDLHSGKARRLLDEHPTVRAQPFSSARTGSVEGRLLLVGPPGEHGTPPEVGAVGITLSADASTLYWSKPDTLTSAPTELLADPDIAPTALDAAIRRWPGRDFSSDGLDTDLNGRLLFTDVTNGAVQRLNPAQERFEVLAIDERLSWPDGVATGANGDVYVTSSQFHRSGLFNHGKDRRHRPFGVFRLRPP